MEAEGRGTCSLAWKEAQKQPKEVSPIPGYLRYSAGVQVAVASTEGEKQSAQSPGPGPGRNVALPARQDSSRATHAQPLRRKAPHVIQSLGRVARRVEQGPTQDRETWTHWPCLGAWGTAPPKGHFTPAGDNILGRAPLCREEVRRPEGRSQGRPGGPWNPKGALATPPARALPSRGAQLPAPYLNCFVSSICCGTTQRSSWLQRGKVPSESLHEK